MSAPTKPFSGRYVQVVLEQRTVPCLPFFHRVTRTRPPSASVSFATRRTVNGWLTTVPSLSAFATGAEFGRNTVTVMVPAVLQRPSLTV